jgi:5-methylcytosine-specific restriction endonuclease McrA
MRRRWKKYHKPFNPYSIKRLREKTENELTGIIQQKETELLGKKHEISLLRERVLKLKTKEDEYNSRLNELQSVSGEIIKFQKQLNDRPLSRKFIHFITQDTQVTQLKNKLQQLERAKDRIGVWLNSFNADSENNPIAVKQKIENKVNEIAVIQKIIDDCKSVIASKRRMVEVEKNREVRKKEEEEKLRKKREEEKRIKARLAAYDGKSREIATGLKRQLKKYDVCPYCFGALGNYPEADHIIPIAQGGLSIETNMVYICKDCNQKKRDMTLREFCEKFKRDRMQIEDILVKLGKRI